VIEISVVRQSVHTRFHSNRFAGVEPIVKPAQDPAVGPISGCLQGHAYRSRGIPADLGCFDECE